jgi:hypothetical protein
VGAAVLMTVFVDIFVKEITFLWRTLQKKEKREKRKEKGNGNSKQ